MAVIPNPQILEDLKKNFTVVKIDLYGEGHAEDIITILCYANEYSEKDIELLFHEYDLAYSTRTYDGMFEDYLATKGVNYCRI